MKTTRLLFTILLSHLVQTAICQTTGNTTTKTNPDVCDVIKKENEYLKVSLNINSGIKEKVENEVEFKIIKVTGDSKTQIVKVEFLMTNKIQNREIFINRESKLVTIEGDVIKANSAIIAGDNSANKAFLNTDVPIKSSFSFPPILPSNKYIKLLSFNYTLNPGEYSKRIDGLVEFRDLEINWN